MRQNLSHLRQNNYETGIKSDRANLKKKKKELI